MKLLLCRACQDVVKIFSAWRSCRCGESQARYVSDNDVEFSGADVMILGVSNTSLEHAVRTGGRDVVVPVEAWMIPETSESIRRIP